MIKVIKLFNFNFNFIFFSYDILKHFIILNMKKKYIIKKKIKNTMFGVFFNFFYAYIHTLTTLVPRLNKRGDEIKQR
jgi:hypothetical protein